MATGKDTVTLLSALLLTGGVLVAGALFIGFKPFPNLALKSIFPDQNNSERFSTGEQLLFEGDAQPSKIYGIEVYGKGDYAQAQQLFQSALAVEKNDPEALIYFNNAKASQMDQAAVFTLAVALPVTTDPSGAKEILRGVAQAQNDFNQGSQFLKILIADDADDPAIATSIAEALTKKPEVLGVIGHKSSDASLAAAQVYEANGLVMISATSTSTALSTAGDHIFRTVPSDRFMGNALANHLLNQLQVKQIAIFYNASSAYSNALKESLTTELVTKGGRIVTEIDVSESTFNGAEALADSQARGAEAIALLTDTPTFNQALQVMQVNKNKLPIVAGDSMYKPETLQIGTEDALGLVVSVPWHVLSNPNAAFPKSAQALWGGDVSWRTALAYDATQAFTAAFQRASLPTRQTILVALADPNFSAPGAAETIQFLPSGDRNQAVQMVEVKKGDRSGFGYDFVPIP